MPTLECGEFRIWFGTDDAPAPSGSIPRGDQVAVRIGVLPDDPQLTIRIRYRRQSGTWMMLPAQALPRESEGSPRYFEGVFPGLAPGTSIEYGVQCQRAGKLIKSGEVSTLTFEVVPISSRTGASKRAVMRKAPSADPKTVASGSVSADSKQPSGATAGTTLKTARIAGLPPDVASRIAARVHEGQLLDSAVT